MVQRSSQRGDQLPQRTSHGPFGQIEFTERTVALLTVTSDQPGRYFRWTRPGRGTTGRRFQDWVSALPARARSGPPFSAA